MSENEELNKLDVHKDRKCTWRGRGYPKTILNIEAWLHHRAPLRCEDVKGCQRFVKRAKRSES
jgi:hypothetical protein